MAFVQKIDTSKGKLIWANVNVKDMLPTSIQALADSVFLIQQSLEAYWLVQKAEMYLTDAERVAKTSIVALNLVKEISNSVVGIIAQALDLSFFTLPLKPETGGLNGMLNRVRFHLFDASDPNRPTDDGNAVLIPMMFVVSYADITRAQEAFGNIENLFCKFKKQGGEFLKEFGEDPTKEKPNGFWQHYYRRQIIGTRKRVNETGWYKNSMLDLLPERAVLYLQNALDSWTQAANGTPDSSSLIKKTEAIYNTIFEAIKEIALIIDGYTRLFLDSQISILKFPPVHGEALTAGNTAYKFNKDMFDMLKRPNISYSGKKPAVEVLSEYLYEVPNAMKEGVKEVESSFEYDFSYDLSEKEQISLFGSDKTVPNPFNKENIRENAANFLALDYMVGGIVFMFKGPSIKLVTEQVKAFLSIFGQSLPEEEPKTVTDLVEDGLDAIV